MNHQGLWVKILSAVGLNPTDCYLKSSKPVSLNPKGCGFESQLVLCSKDRQFDAPFPFEGFQDIRIALWVDLRSNTLTSNVPSLDTRISLRLLCPVEVLSTKKTIKQTNIIIMSKGESNSSSMMRKKV